MRLANATWTDADAAAVDVALLPVGSTEQHGPHGPLGTDHLTAARIAEVTAEQSDSEVVVAPTVPIGISEEHRQFTGSLWVTPDTFRAYVRETVESMLDHGWDRIVIVNGHGGNSAAIEEVAARLSREGDALVVPFTWFDAIDTDLDLGHAGAVETSMLLHAFPDLVDDDRLDEGAAGSADRWGEWVGSVNLAHDSAEFSENGAVGDPTAASAEAGERLEAQASSALESVISALVDRDGTVPPHK